MPKKESERLQVNVELQGEDKERFLKAQEKLRLKTKAAAGYVLLMNALDEVMPKQGAAHART